MDKIPQMDELELDLLNEIFNLGVGNAAASLSQMVKQEIKLSVPEIDFLTTDQLITNLGQDKLLCSVSQKVSGPLIAQSIVLFPDADSLEIVRKLLGDQISDAGIAELQNEAMTEIGNIVLNACIGSLSEAFSETFIIDLPEFERATPDALIASKQLSDDSYILFIRIELMLSESKITGYLAFLIGGASFNVLQNSLRKTLDALL
ncbi:MAG: chemotaxis protein CheC [Gammaproteobacteria bacterium]|nr:chemotaxis protein CheC [Gammaproteobacteria bacterium]